MQEKMIRLPAEQVFSAENPMRLKSFIRRNSRRTEAQNAAREAMWPGCGLSLDQGMLDLNQLFKREAPCVLEIGFGSGQSLLAAAKSHPECNFIGIEAHKPGIGSLLMGVQESQLTNVRVFDADAVEVLRQCIPEASLDKVLIFFPDPWQKRRHHKRRLIQTEFLDLLVEKMANNAELHLATDWADYAVHMMAALSADSRFINLAGHREFAERSGLRAVVTKFERRAIKDGRAIKELQFCHAS